MKVIICVLAILVAAEAVPVKNDFGFGVMNFYEKILKALPCGVAGSGPLDPYILDKEFTEQPFELKTEHFNLSIHIKSLEVSGIKSLKVDSPVYNPDSKQFKMYFIPPQLHLKSNYSWSTYMDLDGEVKMSHNDEGFVDAHFKFPQEKIGISFYFATDEVTRNLTIKGLSFEEPEFDWEKNFSFLGDKTDEIISELKPTVKEIEKDLGEMFIEKITEHANKIVVNYKDVDHITEELYKAAGDDHTGPFGDKLCVH